MARPMLVHHGGWGQDAREEGASIASLIGGVCSNGRAVCWLPICRRISFSWLAVTATVVACVFASDWHVCG